MFWSMEERGCVIVVENTPSQQYEQFVLLQDAETSSCA
jgi:hypothetical protein